MTCENIQIQLLQDNESAEVRAHLERCPECREYARLARLIEAPAPSAELDAKVLAGYRSRRSRLLILSWRRTLAVAATILFAGMITAIELNRRVSDLPPVLVVYNVNHQDVEFLKSLYSTEHSQLVDTLRPVELLTSETRAASESEIEKI
jgi:hypothetical protein